MSRNKQLNKRREANKRKRALKRKTRLHTKSMQDSPQILPQHKTPENKLSEVILEYAEPLANDIEGAGWEFKAISMSIVFWNASLIPKQEALKTLDEYVAKIEDDHNGFKKDFYSIFDMMYHRKQKHFKSDNRFIVDYSLRETDEGLYFEVASTSYER